MKLKPVKKELKKKVVVQKIVEEEPIVEKKKKTNKKENKLPPDTYKPMFDPIRLLVRETPSTKSPSKMVKQYLELSVKRYGEDEENAPMVYVQMYQESEFYTGYLKGKTIHLPLEALYEFIDSLNDLSEECDKRHII